MNRYVRVALLTLAAVCFSFSDAFTQTETILHSFAGGTDGATPEAGLIADSKGNGYGTTFSGDPSGLGMVFRINASGEKILHSFANNSTDGANPEGGLVLDKSGNLYGTTTGGGAYGYGTVFKIANSSGLESIIYNFGQTAGDATDPNSSLTIDAEGNLYGVSYTGGASNVGTVFKVFPSNGTETVLYSFTGGADGSGPIGVLALAGNGNLYGTTFAGGSSDLGTVFELQPGGRETVLHSFLSGTDGALPLSGISFSPKGYLYGTTEVGGANSVGTVFQINLPARTYSIFYSFTYQTGDGNFPMAGVIFDTQGNLYGTTNEGGNNGGGAVYSISPSGEETVLWSFGGNGDGFYPVSRLLRDTHGNLYGTTTEGGKYDLGTIFKVTP